MAGDLDFEAVLAASPNPYMVLDRELRFVAANPAYLKVTSSKLEELLGRPVTDVFPRDPDDPNNDSVARLRASLARVLETGEPDILPLIPYRVRVGDGRAARYEDLLWSATHTPIKNAAGEVTFILQHTTDVTKLQRLKLAATGARPPGTEENPATEAGVLGLAEAVQRDNLALNARLKAFEGLFEHAPGFMCFLRGPRLCTEFANAAYYELVGRRAVIGKPLLEAFPELAGQGVVERLEAVFRSGEPFVGRALPVHLRRSSDGQLDDVFADFVLQPVFETDNRVAGVLVHGSDVTQRKLAEDRLRRNEERLRAVFDAAQAGTWEMDYVTGEIRADARTRALFGIQEPTLTLDALIAAVHPGDRGAVEGALRAALSRSASGKYHAEHRTQAQSGRRAGEDHVWVEAHGQVFFEGGAPRRMLVGVVDITERKYAELNALQLARVLDATRDFVGISNLQGEPIFMNAAGLRMVGLRDREALSKERVQNFFVERQRDEVQARVMETALRDGYWEGELMFRHFQTGEEIPVLYSVFPVQGLNGSATALATITRDLRTQKAAEAERAELLQNEKIAREQAEEANRLKDEFLATVSHELRTPLTAMLGWLHLLNTGSLTEQKRASALRTVERNARAQAQLIDDLLDVSRILAGKLTLDMQTLDVNSVIAAAIDTVRPAAEAKKITIDAALEATGQVLGDFQRLQQVIWNLLSNAVKFTAASGCVRVRAVNSGSDIVISVEDTGAGIAPEILPFIFERFRQADGGFSRRKGGLGLGLSIVRNLVERHGGSVVAHSRGVGQGARFTVRLPRAKSICALPSYTRALAGRAGDPVDSQQELRGLRVLVVEDEEDTRKYVAALLERHSALVTEASSAAEALTALAQSQFDVVLSDIAMPGEDGYALIRRIRALPAGEGGSTPAVALTAYARAEDRERTMSAGFQNHVSKPVDPAELLAVVAAAACRSARGQPEPGSPTR